MSEQFTQRAERVMVLADQEAQRFNHEYVGTEHILLGLIKGGSSISVGVLNSLGVDLSNARREVEKLVPRQPDERKVGRLPLTPRAKAALEYATEEARSLNHNYVGPEHLLLGLLREQDGIAAQVLMNLGLKLADIREKVLNALKAEIYVEPPPKRDKARMAAALRQIAHQIIVVVQELEKPE